MRLTVLVDNNTLIDKNYFGEPGLSYYIEDEEYKILFDVGYSDIFLRNAHKMGIHLQNINFVILSHGHLDHTWGMSNLIGNLDYFGQGNSGKSITLVAHPLALCPKIHDGEQIGFIYSEEALKACFDFQLSRNPFWISKKLVFLGQIERVNGFENRQPLGITFDNGIPKEDFLLDDSALVYKADKGLVVITGCSHSGICNIIENARKICGEERILDVIGGFHLLKPSETQLEGTLEYMKKLQPGFVHACHCTDLDSKIALSRVVNLKEVGVGTELVYD